MRNALALRATVNTHVAFLRLDIVNDRQSATITSLKYDADSFPIIFRHVNLSCHPFNRFVIFIAAPN